MSDKPNGEEKVVEHLLHDLRERAKELNCLYEVQKALTDTETPIDDIFWNIVQVLPPGWQYPEICQAEIVYGHHHVRTQGFIETPWILESDIYVQEERSGAVRVVYTEDRPNSDEGPFLKEERKLINTIAEEIGFFIFHQQLRSLFQEQKRNEERINEWQVIMDLLKRTDPELLMRISRKMIFFLGSRGVKEVEDLFEKFTLASEEIELSNDNRPLQGKLSSNLLELNNEIFQIASQSLSKDIILEKIRQWSEVDRVDFLINILANPSSTFSEISSAVERYHLLFQRGIELSDTRKRWLQVSLIQRVLSDQPGFVRTALKYIEIDDFSDLMRHIIFPVQSNGKLGGKSSGLFLASRILDKSPLKRSLLDNVRIPKTWYLTSDVVFYFMWYNGFQDFIDQKYKDIAQVRQEYPYIIQVFKNAQFPPEIVKGLSLALEDFGDVPLIVRSSGLMEDQEGIAFAGKYKSLFIANKGSKEERLAALLDAVAEVFASQFSPDPIEYRNNHEILDMNEELGVMIQEVVGTLVGDYYLPSFAGVAFKKNVVLWSSRIQRDDGLLRVVPGLGTRAVDRIRDDFPILAAPGQPGLNVNVTPEEIIRYSPRKVDLINLKNNAFDTVEIQDLLKKYGREYPNINQLLSVVEGNQIRNPGSFGVNFEKEEFVVTFKGLFSRTNFLAQIDHILNVLSNELGYAVDIEFAHDGTNFYLLQCRPQSYGGEIHPPEIPADIPPEDLLFRTHRYVPDGKLTNITHLVYVDPEMYGKLENQEDLFAVGKVIGLLNQQLPAREYLLMGPGRWGSRGDIRLGVNVRYSDISNTAMLIEITGNHETHNLEASFGTHFFLDLVEASIIYLPISLGDEGVIFNREWIMKMPNHLLDFQPDAGSLLNVVHIIDIPASTKGMKLNVFMNGDVGTAVAIFT